MSTLESKVLSRKAIAVPTTTAIRSHGCNIRRGLDDWIVFQGGKIVARAVILAEAEMLAEKASLESAIAVAKAKARIADRQALAEAEANTLPAN